MGQAAVLAARRIIVVALVALLAGFGCATRSVYDVPVRMPDEDAHTRTERPPGSSPLELPIAERPPVAIVLNDPHHAYLELMQVFSAELGRPYEVLNLAHRSPESVRRKLAALAPIQTIVVGAAALAAASDVPGVQVFHAGVLSPGRTGPGVDALPPFDAQLDEWLLLSPEIERIGVIGSPAMRPRIEALAEACEKRAIDLERREVGSDKETLLAFRSMVPHIDGFVFLPDGDILSPKVIEQVVVHGRRNDVQVLVYSPVMYELGASLFVQPDPVLVAAMLIELLIDPSRDATVREMRTLTRLGSPVETTIAAAEGGQ